MSGKIKKAIIPVAGLGTRFLPVTKATPKEMLPIVDKPTIHYLVEEAIASGIEEIIFVTSQGKDSIANYFDHNFELHQRLKEKGKTKELKELEELETMAKFAYVRQPHPNGDGDAILCAKELIKNEPIAVLFGDDMYDSDTPALSQLIATYEKYNAPVVALTKIEKEESEKYGIVKIEAELESELKLKDFVEKPSQDKAPSSFGITGKYIVTPKLLKTLETSSPTHRDKELRLIDALKQYVKKSPVYGTIIKGERFDTGDKLGYLKAVIHYGLKHKKIGRQLKKYIQHLDLE